MESMGSCWAQWGDLLRANLGSESFSVTTRQGTSLVEPCRQPAVLRGGLLASGASAGILDTTVSVWSSHLDMRGRLL
jgi:hypothetical protein